MLDANKLLIEGIEQVKLAGLTPGTINPIVGINTRAVKRFGLCKKVPHGKYDYEIEINAQLLNVDKSKLMNTLIHEILHTCKGCMNHGVTWKNYANIMNNKFGYDISRTSSYEEKGVERPKPNYIIECKGCGTQFHRQKKSKLITHTERYRCKCGSKLRLI